MKKNTTKTAKNAPITVNTYGDAYEYTSRFGVKLACSLQVTLVMDKINHLLEIEARDITLHYDKVKKEFLINWKLAKEMSCVITAEFAKSEEARLEKMKDYLQVYMTAALEASRLNPGWNACSCIMDGVEAICGDDDQHLRFVGPDNEAY